MPGLLEGKFGLIATLSERHGYPWGIARACLREGARLAFAHQARFASHVQDLTAEIPGAVRFQLDLGAPDTDEQLGRGMTTLEQEFGGLDFVVHTPAFAPPAAMMGRITDTTRQDFLTALDVSAYSLLALTRAAEPLFKRRGGGSVVGCTYYGGEKVVLGYKVMGVAKAALDSISRYLAAELGPDNIRVNLLSLGPQRTVAARGIPGFMDMLRLAGQMSPLQRNIDTEDAGNAAVFLCSEWGRNVTGEILHVDCGYNILGFWHPGAQAPEDR
ncbi:MAG TPA: SDR family oxidoreductase [Chloroflexota bacterium]|jgi:enoyl-[acyl-carrier protein] reductase I|nr:SDR family oxidoreductase [Chloroflexota bacterium]